ncbi:hypothetical protein FXO38_33707 [Capsicum annuum]|nr:hypothetical protein FXO38_33707 [Capsicum annuum]KAF3633866.1 hypothetical protein FXO37_26819 [Capsicum annuum]
MGYVLVENEWCRKKSAQMKTEPPKELQEFKQHFKAIKERIIQLQESTAKIIDLGKSTNFDISVVRLGLNKLKQEGVKLFSRVLSRMDSLKSQVSSSNDDLVICI